MAINESLGLEEGGIEEQLFAIKNKKLAVGEPKATF